MQNNFWKSICKETVELISLAHESLPGELHAKMNNLVCVMIRVPVGGLMTYMNNLDIGMFDFALTNTLPNSKRKVMIGVGDLIGLPCRELEVIEAADNAAKLGLVSLHYKITTSDASEMLDRYKSLESVLIGEFEFLVYKFDVSEQDSVSGGYDIRFRVEHSPVEVALSQIGEKIHVRKNTRD